ncbi:MarR family transcriptional regulator [bacterium]|nr:MAG: MarR family transcriptional regulator [bacterium]
MPIEDKIKQAKFRNEHHRLLANLFYQYNGLIYEQQKILKPFDISFQQFNILSILRGQYPNTASIQLLKERLLDQNSDVSRLVDRLLKKKLLNRNTCPEDRRQVDVIITEKGLELLAQIDEKASQIDSLVSNLSSSEAETLNKLLDKIR